MVDQVTPVWKSAYVVRVEDQSGEDVIVGSGLYEMKTEKLFVVETVDAAADLVERGVRRRLRHSETWRVRSDIRTSTCSSTTRRVCSL